MIWRPYPIALICGRENAVTIIKNRVQYTRGFTKRTFISPAFTSFATLANSTATREIKGNDKLTPYTKYTKHFEVSGSYSRRFWFQVHLNMKNRHAHWTLKKNHNEQLNTYQTQHNPTSRFQSITNVSMMHSSFLLTKRIQHRRLNQSRDCAYYCKCNLQ